MDRRFNVNQRLPKPFRCKIIRLISYSSIFISKTCHLPLQPIRFASISRSSSCRNAFPLQLLLSSTWLPSP